MSSGRSLRQRLLFLQETNNFNWSIIIGDKFIDSITRFDVSDPNYLKLESAMYPWKPSYGDRRMELMCIVVSYSKINAIILPKFDSKGVQQYTDNLSPDVSSVGIPEIEPIENTMRFVMQKMSALSQEMRKQFNVVSDDYVYEGFMDYSVADPNVLVGIFPWYQITTGRTSIAKVMMGYDAIELLYIGYDVYKDISTGPDFMPDKHKIRLPWEP